MSKRLISPSVKTRRSERRSASTGGKHAAKTRQIQEPPAGEPFEDTLATQTAIEGAGERAADSIEALPEREHEIGIADWIDPQTGEPAEGQSPPHLEAE